jgi:hypothetical protein
VPRSEPEASLPLKRRHDCVSITRSQPDGGLEGHVTNELKAEAIPSGTHANPGSAEGVCDRAGNHIPTWASEDQDLEVVYRRTRPSLGRTDDRGRLVALSKCRVGLSGEANQQGAGRTHHRAAPLRHGRDCACAVVSAGGNRGN